jgi:Mor family transcriptional regulator
VIIIEKENKNYNTLNGVYESISEIIGFDNVVKLYENFKGSQINFPTRLFSKEFVLQEAIKAYDGTSESINMIATKYSYSERTIRKLLKEHLDSI